MRGKGRGGHNGASRSGAGGGESESGARDERTAHVLVSSDKCGLIIGKGGSTIRAVGKTSA